MPAASPRPGRPQSPREGGRPGRAEFERVLMRLDALQEAVRLLAEGATEDPAYEAAAAVQRRRRGMRLAGGEDG